MQNKYSISVVIPTYNRADLLIKAVESVLTQQYEVEEILVCDDGSTDNSKQKILNLSSSKIKWIDCGKNGRPAIPRNIGIREAKANWIAFLDSDDTWLPQKLSEQVERLKKNDYKAVCSNAIRIREDEEHTDYFDFPDTEITFNSMLQSNKVICSSMMVQRDLLISVGMFSEAESFKAIEDYNLWIKISSFSQIAYLSSTLVRYRDQPNQSIRQTGKTLKEQKTIIFEDILKWIPLTDLNNKQELLMMVQNELKSILDISLKTKLWRLKNWLFQKFKR